MKRFVISLLLIFVFVSSAVAFDQWYVNRFKNQLNAGVDAVVEAGDERQRLAATEELNAVYDRARFIVSQFVFANRLEEVETLLRKLSAYIEIGNEEEIGATAEEFRSRVDLLE